MATAEKQLYSRNKLVASLMKIGHSDLSLYIPEGLAAAKADADVLGHFIAWNEKNGKVRDSKVALPPLALRGLTKQDADLAENAVAHMLLLSPRDLERSYDFSKKLTADGHNIPAGFRKLLQQGIKTYLEQREASTKWWDRTVLQHRKSVKALYRLAHKTPSPRAQKILFDGEFPPSSIFGRVASLKTLQPKEAAGVILEYEIPFDVAIGAVAKAKDKDIQLALIEGMTGNQLITNTQMLQRFGVMNDPVLKSAYEKALERAKSDSKVETLKAGRAAERLKGTDAAGKMSALQETKTKQLGGIDGDWLVLGDASGSMEQAIEIARQIAGIITERVSGSVYLVFFDSTPTFVDVSHLSYAQIVEKTRRINAGGSTSIGCGLDYVRSKNLIVNGIVVVSDGGENCAPMFVDTYRKYCQQLSVEPTVYFFQVRGSDSDVFSRNLNLAGIQLETFDMRQGVDYYSLPNIVKTLRANRYALFDEVMETSLLTINQIYERRAA